MNPADFGFDILFEEGPCLIVQKPGGVLTQAPPGIDSLEVRIKRFLKQRDNKPGRIYLGVPHRLDRPVSGAMVFGKHARATRRLAEQFEGRIVKKSYWAVVEGIVEPDQGEWADYVRKIPGQARSETVAEGDPEGRVAILRYRVLSRSDTATALEIELETGRTHQVRVQAASRGHAILGDEFYGATTRFGPQTNDQRARWIALHARRLEVRHPMTRQPVAVTAPLPEPWNELAVTEYPFSPCPDS